MERVELSGNPDLMVGSHNTLGEEQKGGEREGKMNNSYRSFVSLLLIMKSLNSPNASISSV